MTEHARLSESMARHPSAQPDLPMRVPASWPGTALEYLQPMVALELAEMFREENP